MLHYHVWFDFKPQITERDGVSIINSFLTELLREAKIAGFRILKNAPAPPKTRLAAYDALIEFQTETQFAAAFDELQQIGIHTDPHGTIIRIVCNFSADVFKQVPG